MTSQHEQIQQTIRATLRLLDSVGAGPTAAERGDGPGDDEPTPPAAPAPRARRAADWPAPMRSPAFVGVAGEVVRALAPYSEADDAAVLATLLAAIGNLAGPGVGWTVSGRRHGLRFWPVLVGPTGKGRKGTSWGIVRPLLARIDGEWLSGCVAAGLTSGEWLIWRIRDRVARQGADGAEEVVDPGVEDKRLFVIEEEFPAVLRVARRDGNTLSPTLRLAYDGDPLATLAKNSPARATEPHVTLLGHATVEELRTALPDGELANGFANRFAFVCVRRARLLPDGATPPPELIDRLGGRLSAALALAGRNAVYARDAGAAELWDELYPALTDGKPGLAGAVTSRAEVQVMRLAAIYALLDGAFAIRRVDLEAALAVWDYCAASARLIFGQRLGDPLAEQIVQALRIMPLNQSQLQLMLGTRTPVVRLVTALRWLRDNGLIVDERVQGAGSGRPATRWRLAERRD